MTKWGTDCCGYFCDKIDHTVVHTAFTSSVIKIVGDTDTFTTSVKIDPTKVYFAFNTSVIKMVWSSISIGVPTFFSFSLYFFLKMLRQDSDVSETLDRIRYHHMLRNRQSEVDLNLMPRRGMAYERGVMIVSNPYTEDAMKKYNSMEMLMPRTGEVVHICKLPQSLYTPGKLVVHLCTLPWTT